MRRMLWSFRSLLPLLAAFILQNIFFKKHILIILLRGFLTLQGWRPMEAIRLARHLPTTAQRSAPHTFVPFAQPGRHLLLCEHPVPTLVHRHKDTSPAAEPPAERDAERTASRSGTNREKGRNPPEKSSPSLGRHLPHPRCIPVKLLPIRTRHLPKALMPPKNI